MKKSKTKPRLVAEVPPEKMKSLKVMVALDGCTITDRIISYIDADIAKFGKSRIDSILAANTSRNE